MLRVFGQTGSKAFRELVAIDPIGYRGIKVRRHSAGCSAVYTFCTLMAETEMTRIFRIGGKHFPFDGLYNVRVAFGGAPDADSDLTRRKKHDTRGVPNAVSSGRLVLRLARKCPVPEQVCRSSPVACISTAQTVDLTYLFLVKWDYCRPEHYLALLLCTTWARVPCRRLGQITRPACLRRRIWTIFASGSQ